MTKDELREALLRGERISDLFEIRKGQGCEIVKESFTSGEDILYIPDLTLNEIPMDMPVRDSDVDDVIEQCYTGDDFMWIAGGDVRRARALYLYCDWQHPEAAWEEDVWEADDMDL